MKWDEEYVHVDVKKKMVFLIFLGIQKRHVLKSNTRTRLTRHDQNESVLDL